MKKQTAGILIVLTSLVTVGVTFLQPSVIHQLAVWVSGCFGVLVILALFVVRNWPDAVEISAEEHIGTDAAIIRMVRHYRTLGYSDHHIAIAMKTDIAVVEAIPQ